VYVGKEVLGVVGEYKNIVKSNFKIPTYSAGFEINLNCLVANREEQKKYIDTPIFPSVIKDFSFELNDTVKYSDLNNDILKIINRDTLFGYTECLDIYKKEKGEDKKKVTVRIDVKHFEKTLSSKDIKKISEKITNTITRKYGAKVL
jgi:phenylalanyl-tRNA synthetase beta chain